MSKPKVFVTRVIPDQGLDMIRDFCDLDIWQEEYPPNREELLKRVQGMDGLLTLLTDKIDGEVMDAAGEQLKVISNHAVGLTILTSRPRLHARFRWGTRRMCSPTQPPILPLPY